MQEHNGHLIALQAPPNHRPLEANAKTAPPHLLFRQLRQKPTSHLRLRRARLQYYLLHLDLPLPLRLMHLGLAPLRSALARQRRQ